MFITPTLATVILIIGIMIGGLGIGGVLLVPSLKYLGGFELHDVIPACMMSYMVTGVAGTIIFSRHGTINWRLAFNVCVGALPGAYIGAYFLAELSAQLIETGIALLLIYSGADALFKTDYKIDTSKAKAFNALYFHGFIAAIGSSLTGTGGPLLLIPMLMWHGVSALTAIGLSQVIQIPISLMATVANYIHGDVDLQLSLTLALCLGIGAISGAWAIHLLPVVKLKKFMALLLILVGILLLNRIVMVT
ncbi:MAG: sulfite exporter TauE/SafE family protein [Candidatus Thiodiazotropha sp.]